MPQIMMTDDPALCRRISGIPVLIAESSFVCIEETSLTFPKMLAALMPLINFERLIEDFNQPGSGQSLRSDAKETFASPADAVATPSEIVALCVILKSWEHAYLQIPNIQLDVC
ncbi:Cupin domain family protein [Aspergillus niger]|uniref:Cupin domain family protein n=1 Tax=Aspergillus niger TaxID=5061 RepID=A0A505IAP3_ASPNG|nr:Cupin domain family protein [Aspergillus niger]